MSNLPVVLVSSGDSTGFLNWEDGDTIEIGSQRWFDWLDQYGSFRFESGEAGEDSFTARKHNRKSGDFWYAYRKLGKELCNSYLGKSEALTVERMLHVAQKLSQSKPKSKLGKSYAKEPGECINDKLGKKETGYAQKCITEKQQEWNCYAIHPESGEEWFILGECQTEKALRNAAHKAFTRWDCDPYPGCRIEYRGEPVGSAIKAKLRDVERNWTECLKRNVELSRKRHEFEEEAKQLRSQLTQTQVQLEDQAAKAGEWYERTKAVEEENAQLRSQLAEAQAQLQDKEGYLEICRKKLSKAEAKLREADHQTRPVDPNAIALLQDALALKANAGGKIKEEIKKALAIFVSPQQQ